MGWEGKDKKPLVLAALIALLPQYVVREKGKFFFVEEREGEGVLSEEVVGKRERLTDIIRHTTTMQSWRKSFCAGFYFPSFLKGKKTYRSPFKRESHQKLLDLEKTQRKGERKRKVLATKIFQKDGERLYCKSSTCLFAFPPT